MGKSLIGFAGLRMMGTFVKGKGYYINQAVQDPTSENWFVSRHGQKTADTDTPNMADLPADGKTNADWMLWTDLKSVKEAKEAATTAAGSANTAASSANTAATNANNKAALADKVAKHPPYVGDDGYWYYYNATTEAYEKSDKYAQGGVDFPAFSVDPETLELSVDAENAGRYELCEDGELYVTF